ncbi:MAG: ATP-binding protein [Gemmatimonadetes bacterium]|nr:ATP-binding protein [Gemmatimonadota bacterium]
MFDRFFRADASRTRSGDSPRGAGLGLSIAKRIVKAHGGELVLASSRPGGTEFTFWLPRSTR